MVRGDECDVGNAMRDEIDLGRTASRYTSCKMVRPRSVMTTSRVERAINSSITRRWSAFGFEENGVERGDHWRVSIRAAEANKWLPAGPPKIPNSCWTETTSTLLEFRKSRGAPVRIQILLLNFEANDVRIPIDALDVIDRDGEARALGMPRCHRSEQVGRKRGNAALTRQVVTEERDRCWMCEAVFERFYG